MKTKFVIVFVLFSFGVCLVSPAQNKPTFKFNHIAIYVTKLEQSHKFYMQTLGLDSIAEPFHDHKHLWLNIGSGSLHIIEGATKKKEYYQNNHICLSTNDFDGLKNVLEKNKISWMDAQGQIGLTTKRPDGILQIWIQDPDGYNIEINNDNK
jgi:lactoylglutathione lyase